MQDFHKCDGNKLLSAGMDHSIKIWDLSGVSYTLFECCSLPYGDDIDMTPDHAVLVTRLQVIESCLQRQLLNSEVVMP